MAGNDCTKTAEVSMSWTTAGNTEKVYEDEPLAAGGYDFGKVDPDRVYSLKGAAELIGMSYQEAWNAVTNGSIHAVRSTWNNRRILVRGSELLRVMREEFVEVPR